MIKRIDFGARIAGDKAKKSDEFIVKSQLVTPNGEALEVLDNGDIVVPVAASVLPPGLEDQTFRHNGTDWEANDKILSSATVTTITTDHVNVNSTTEYGPPGSTFHVPLLNIDVANEEAVTAQVGGLSLRNYFDDTVTVQNDRMAFDSQAGSIVTTMENRPLENRKSYTHVIECNGVELERLEYDSTQPSINTVTFNGEIVSKELAGIGDRYIGAADNGAIKIMPTPEGGGGLPDGTVNGSTSRWNGTVWVENTAVTSDGIGLNVGTGTNSAPTLWVKASSSANSVSTLLYITKNSNMLLKVNGLGILSLASLAGTGNRPLYANSSGNIVAQSDGIMLQRAKITLTATQIRSLHTTPITLVTAPGSNKVIFPHRILAKYTYADAMFTAVGLPNIHCGIASDSIEIDLLITSEATSQLISKQSFLYGYDTNMPTNLPLKIYMMDFGVESRYENLSANGYITFIVEYTIEDLS